MNNDSFAIILLCSDLAIDYKNDEIRPYTLKEWNKLATKILNSSIKRPGNLFELSKEEMECELSINGIEYEKIKKLLSKSGQLGFLLDALNNMGIKIMTRADRVFPRALKATLKDKCPALLYYCGDTAILDEKLIGVVGSRNIDYDGTEFAKLIGKKIVNEGYSLVSGGAKGVDLISQQEVLLSGGKVVTVIADSMVERIKKKDIREAIVSKKLLIVSSTNPKKRFTVYSAMNRNKYIYGLSQMTVVVSADSNKGGTWAGAMESIKNKWVPVIVRKDKNAPKGNGELIDEGARAIELGTLDTPFEEFKKPKKQVGKGYQVDEGHYDKDLFQIANNKSQDNNKEQD